MSLLGKGRGDQALLYMHLKVLQIIYVCVIPEGFEDESFPLKYNITSSEYKIHSVEVNYIISNIYKPKIKYFKYFLPMYQVGGNDSLNSEF